MLNVALVGFGLSGRYLQAPFFLTNPDFNLKTIVSGSQNPQAIYPSVGVARSIDEVLADTEIDLVSIASPSHLHFSQAKQALLAGKHVLVENLSLPPLPRPKNLSNFQKARKTAINLPKSSL